MGDFLQGILLSSPAIGVLLLLLARIIPNKKLKEIGVSHGKKLTALAKGKMGKPWEKIETFIQNSFSVYWDGFQEGLDSDDKK